MQVAIVPEGYFQANGRRMSYARVGLEGDGNVAQKAVLVRQGTFMYDSFRSQIAAYTGVGNGVNEQVTFGNGITSSARFTDKAPRFTHCLEDLGNGTVRITRNFPAGLGGAQSYTLPGAFPNGPARVIFQDVTYDGPKDAVPTTTSDLALGQHPDLRLTPTGRPNHVQPGSGRRSTSQPIGARSTAKRERRRPRSPGIASRSSKSSIARWAPTRSAVLGRLVVPRDVVVAAVRVDRQHEPFAASCPARRPRR